MKMGISSGDLDLLRRVQNELLKELSSLCRELDLAFWLDFGTLLGARRHQSYIPWDDDVDVGMLSTDLERLINLGSSLLDSRFEFDVCSAGLFGGNYVKLRHKNSKFFDHTSVETGQVGGVYIDIFPYAHAPKRNFFSRYLVYILLTSNYLRHVKYCGGVLEFIKRIKFFAIAPFASVMYKYFVSKDWYALHPFDNGTCKIFAKEEIFPLTSIVFDGVKYPAPAKIDSYLVEHYGEDFLTPPPESERVTHAYRIEIYDK